MRLKAIILIAAAASLTLSSCVENRLPQPTWVPSIKTLTADSTLTVKINREQNCVTLDMDETVDLAEVNITSCTFNDDSVVTSSIPLVDIHDLNRPLEFNLLSYGRSYPWKISATQTIQRLFIVSGQVGSTTVDEFNCRVLLKVSKSTPKTWLTVQECKLGPRGQTTYSTDPFKIKDFSNPVPLQVRYRDKVEDWTILVEQSQLAVDIRRISPRVHCCHIEVEAPEGANNGVLVRAKGDTIWRNLSKLSFSAGLLTAKADSLSALTTYECRAYTGADTTDIKEFKTLQEVQLPNAGLEETYNVGNYFEFYNPSSADPACKTLWWGSGNGSSTGVSGSADMGFVICAPDEEIKAEGKRSARLQSAWAIVKFAAGNLFSGQFAGLVGTSGGIVHFGRPFTSRPDTLKLMVRYQNGPIDHFNGCPDGSDVKLGDPDKCQVFVALGDWDPKTYGGTEESPVEVNTTKKSSFFDPSSSAVIAYGTFLSSEPIGEWREISIPLEYRDNFREPTHIIVSCAASYLGDYFTGYSGSRMWVDDFRLIY